MSYDIYTGLLKAFPLPTRAGTKAQFVYEKQPQIFKCDTVNAVAEIFAGQKKNRRKAMLFISIILLLFTTGCDFAEILFDVPDALYAPDISGYFHKEIYMDEEGFRDVTDFCIYYYDEEAIKKFETHEKFKMVTKDDIEYIGGFFENFSEALANLKHNDKFTFDYKQQIKDGDYYFLIIKDPNEIYGEYHDYDIYYVDMEKHTLYFIHSNS
ncbi:MAG: hypothetical protein FWG69_03340 [Oscillospiraceae bacterium]|nr:hypothetical protein [Oscillospiraceae bacterium]